MCISIGTSDTQAQAIKKYRR